MIKNFVIFAILIGFGIESVFAQEYPSYNYKDDSVGIRANLPKNWLSIESLVYENNVPMNVILSFPPLAAFGGTENFTGIMIAHSDNESIASVSYFDSLKSSGCTMTDNNATILEFNEMKATEFNLTCMPHDFTSSEIDALGYALVNDKNTFFVVYLGSESEHKSTLAKFTQFKNSVQIKDTIDLSDNTAVSLAYGISTKSETIKIDENINMPMVLYRDSTIQNIKFDADTSTISFVPVANDVGGYFHVDIKTDEFLDPAYSIDVVGDNVEYFIVSDTTTDKTFVSIQSESPAEIITIKGQPRQTATTDPVMSDSLIIIPEWIKTNASWWADGQIDDGSFISGIQFLVKQEIIHVSADTPSLIDSKSEKIPFWIKNNAGWWSQGLISDAEFARGIQYLIQNEVIHVLEV